MTKTNKKLLSLLLAALLLMPGLTACSENSQKESDTPPV